MTQINGFSAYQNTMMNALNKKQKADADKTAKKADEQEKIRAAKRNERADKSDKTAGTRDTEVQLSDRAKALLEELKSKYGNMDFFVADYSTEAEAQSYLSRGTKEYSVLIDPATLEAMAADEETKAKYTGMIDEATAKLADMKDQLAEDDGTEVKRIGITFNDDGTMSMFAELEQISERRREAIAKEREARKAEAKAAEEQAEKKAAEEKDKENVGGIPQASGPHPAVNLFEGFIPRDEKVKRTTVTANTVDDLLSKIQNVNWDEIEAVDAKPHIGGKFNFSV